jgi:hypothetical protein
LVAIAIQNQEEMSPPPPNPSSPPPEALTGDSPSTLAATTPAPGLNPNVAPFHSAGASSSHAGDEIPSWLFYNPSSSSSDDSERLPSSNGKGKAPLEAWPSAAGDEGHDGRAPCSSFMEVACRAPPTRQLVKEEWQLVTRKKKLNKPAAPRALPSHPAHSKARVDLIGLCFNCFIDRHVAKVA